MFMYGTSGRCQGSYYGKRIPPDVKGNILKTIVQPVILYGMETVSMVSSHAKKMEVIEMTQLYKRVPGYRQWWTCE